MGNLIKTLSPSAAHARSRPIENDVSDLLYLYMVKKYGDMNGSEHYQNILKNKKKEQKQIFIDYWQRQRAKVSPQPNMIFVQSLISNDS